MIYLWWAVEPAEAQTSFVMPVDSLHGSLDWESSLVRQLEEIVLTAYPTSTDLHVLADHSDIDANLMSSGASLRRNTRELLDAVARDGQVDALLETVLRDPSAASVHEPVRGLVGSEWLQARGLLP